MPCVQGFGIFDGPSDDASVAAMASWTGVNAVRVPNEDCWLGINGFPNGGNTAAQYRSAVQSYVAKLHAHGLFAIVEFHLVGAGDRRCHLPGAHARLDIQPSSSLPISHRRFNNTFLPTPRKPVCRTLAGSSGDPWRVARKWRISR